MEITRRVQVKMSADEIGRMLVQHLNLPEDADVNFILMRADVYLGRGARETVFRGVEISYIERSGEDVDRMESLKALAERLAGRSVTIVMRANEEQKLFRSVGAEDIAKAIRNEHGPEIDSDQVVLEAPIQELGVFDVKLHIAEDIESSVKVWVVKETT